MFLDEKVKTYILKDKNDLAGYFELIYIKKKMKLK